MYETDPFILLLKYSCYEVVRGPGSVYILDSKTILFIFLKSGSVYLALLVLLLLFFTLPAGLIQFTSVISFDFVSKLSLVQGSIEFLRALYTYLVG